MRGVRVRRAPLPLREDNPSLASASFLLQRLRSSHLLRQRPLRRRLFPSSTGNLRAMVLHILDFILALTCGDDMMLGYQTSCGYNM